MFRQSRIKASWIASPFRRTSNPILILILLLSQTSEYALLSYPPTVNWYLSHGRPGLPGSWQNCRNTSQGYRWLDDEPICISTAHIYLFTSTNEYEFSTCAIERATLLCYWRIWRRNKYGMSPAGLSFVYPCFALLNSSMQQVALRKEKYFNRASETWASPRMLVTRMQEGDSGVVREKMNY